MNSVQHLNIMEYIIMSGESILERFNVTKRIKQTCSVFLSGFDDTAAVFDVSNYVLPLDISLQQALEDFYDAKIYDTDDVYYYNVLRLLGVNPPTIIGPDEIHSKTYKPLRIPGKRYVLQHASQKRISCVVRSGPGIVRVPYGVSIVAYPRGTSKDFIITHGPVVYMRYRELITYYDGRRFYYPNTVIVGPGELYVYGSSGDSYSTSE